MYQPKPFPLRVTDEQLNDLKLRLSITRWPHQVEPNTDWSAGSDVNYIKNLAQFWHDCDWRAQEDYLNGGLGCGAKHFKMKLKTTNLNIHYCHAKSTKRVKGIPILWLHGWPGSWYEFHKLFPILANNGFDVIAPSLPGYGFSDPPNTKGFGTVSIAMAMDEMMQQLGYTKYVCQGGDWGSAVSLALGQLKTLGRISGPQAMHQNMLTPPKAPPRDVLNKLKNEYTEFDLRGAARGKQFRPHAAYQQIQGTKPMSLGVGLNNSPAGLLSWIVEKLRQWSDCNGDPENAFTKIDMITNVAMYWYGESATSAARLYYEGGLGGLKGEKGLEEFKDVTGTVVEIPYGCALFPEEISWIPLSWIPYGFPQVKRVKKMSKGGHFAAWEQPELLGQELIEFFINDIDGKTLCGVNSSKL